MTEEEWLTTKDLRKALELRPSLCSVRRLRLLACACCRQVWHLLDSQNQNAVLCVERFLDGDITDDDMEAAWLAAYASAKDLRPSPFGAEGLVGYHRHHVSGNAPSAYAAGAVLSAAIMPFERTGIRNPNESAFCAAGSAAYSKLANRRGNLAVWNAYQSKAMVEIMTLLRDIFGNPFRPVTFDPAWRTSTAVGVAEAIYAERTFDNLPILADALQDAGCDHPDILTHLRGPGPHVRGCWVLDLVLGKE